MGKIRIIADSTADLPLELVQKYQIGIVPLSVIIDGEVYQDGVDIEKEAFYQRMQAATHLPTTSQAAPAKFIEAYEKMVQEGAEYIFSIHLSSTLSGNVQAASMVAEEFQKKHPQCKIMVIDSQTATIAMGLFVISLAKAIEAGCSVEEVLAFAERIKEKQELFFVLDSLDNLQKGGRIGKASYLVGSLLNIKPILRLKDGVVHAYDKIRGNKPEKVYEKLVDVIIEHMDINRPVYSVIGNCENAESAHKLLRMLQERGMDCQNCVEIQVRSAVMITHIGIKAFGLAFYQDEVPFDNL